MMITRVIFVLAFTFMSLFGRAVTQPPELVRICPVGDSLVELQWKKPTDVCNSFVEYRIWGRENQSTLFVLLATVNNINIESKLTKLPKAVDITWDFYIEVRFLCDGTSVAFSDTVLIDKQPQQLGIDSVSVDLTTQKIIVGWSDSPEDDVQDYIINRKSTVLDSTVGTSYFDQNSNPNDPDGLNRSYRLTVRDLCSQRSAISEPHSTIFLQRTLDSCRKTITLKWSQYIGWTGISEYRVFVAVNGGNLTQISTTGGNVTQYVYNYNPGDTYQFYVRAVNSSDNSITSSSNLVSQNTRKPIIPAYIYLSQVTVVDNDSISIKWLHDIAGEISEFKVLKSTNGRQFSVIKIVQNDGLASHVVFDNNVDINAQSYFYRIEAYNLCGEYIDSSNTSRSILLEIGDDDILSWNEYIYWDVGVRDYEINRGTDIVANSFMWNVLDTKSDLPLLYEDVAAPLEVGFSGICYYVEARENGLNQYGVSEISTSNIVCDIKPPTVFFPTAFVPTPYGENKLFLPVGAYIDYKKSSFQVYNRWGEQLYDTNDVSLGWDGTDGNGNIYPGGMYIYKAKIFGLDGSFKNFSGTVVLLR